MNVGVHRFFWIGVSGFLWYSFSSGIAGSNGSSSFSFLRIFHTVFHSGYTSLHSHKQRTRVPFSLQPYQHFLFVALLMMAILTGVKLYVILVSICISVVASGVEHFSCVYGTLSMSSLEKHIFRSFARFLIGLFMYYIFGGVILCVYSPLKQEMVSKHLVTNLAWAQTCHNRCWLPTPTTYMLCEQVISSAIRYLHVCMYYLV